MDCHTVERLHAVARPRGDPRWHLVGFLVTWPANEPRPALEDWAAQQGLQGRSHADQLVLHNAAHPAR